MLSEREFIAALIRDVDHAKAYPKDQPDLATRDLKQILAWHDAGVELVIQGIALKKGPRK